MGEWDDPILWRGRGRPRNCGSVSSSLSIVRLRCKSRYGWSYRVLSSSGIACKARIPSNHRYPSRQEESQESGGTGLPRAGIKASDHPVGAIRTQEFARLPGSTPDVFAVADCVAREAMRLPTKATGDNFSRRAHHVPRPLSRHAAADHGNVCGNQCGLRARKGGVVSGGGNEYECGGGPGIQRPLDNRICRRSSHGTRTWAR